MYTTSERIRHVHPYFQSFPYILDHTPPLKQLVMCLNHQSFHIIPRYYVQLFLRLEESHQLLLLQHISYITHKYTFKDYNKVFQYSIVVQIPWGEEDVLKILLAIAYAVKLEPLKPSLLRLPPPRYLFCYSILIYIMILTYWYILSSLQNAHRYLFCLYEADTLPTG